MRDNLRDKVLLSLVEQLEDGQILNHMSELPVDQLVHLASIMREMYARTEEARFLNLAEAAIHALTHLGITLIDDTV
jgi:hypothetical protein